MTIKIMGYIFANPTSGYADKKEKEEILKLAREGKYEDIYNKNALVYDIYVRKALKKDIKINTNSKKTYIKELVIYDYKKNINRLKKLTLISAFTVLTSIQISKYELYFENKEKYRLEIEEYDAKNLEYAKEFENLTDIQVFMKLIDDLWVNTGGYGEASKDIIFFYRLNYLEPNAKGVCRHMADDIAAKLNAINTKYNARTLYVYRKNISNNENNVNNKKEFASIGRKIDKNYVSSFDREKINIIANHSVVIADIDEFLTVVIDPTNPGMGVLYDGEIYWFNRKNSDTLNYKYIFEYLYSVNYSKNSLAFINSFITSKKYSIQELNEQYGLEEQNKAVGFIRKNKVKIRRR